MGRTYSRFSFRRGALAKFRPRYGSRQADHTGSERTPPMPPVLPAESSARRSSGWSSEYSRRLLAYALPDGSMSKAVLLPSAPTATSVSARLPDLQQSTSRDPSRASLTAAFSAAPSASPSPVGGIPPAGTPERNLIIPASPHRSLNPPSEPSRREMPTRNAAPMASSTPSTGSRSLARAPSTALPYMNFRFLPDIWAGMLRRTLPHVPAYDAPSSAAASETMEPTTSDSTRSTSPPSRDSSHAETAPGSPPTFRYSVQRSRASGIHSHGSFRIDSATSGRSAATRNSLKERGPISIHSKPGHSAPVTELTTIVRHPSGRTETMRRHASMSRDVRTLSMMTRSSSGNRAPISEMSIVENLPNLLSANPMTVCVFPQPRTPLTTRLPPRSAQEESEGSASRIIRHHLGSIANSLAHDI